MNDLNKVIVTNVQNQEQGSKLLDRLMSVASPKTVFSEPVNKGEYTVITASEVWVSLGFGYGMGGGAGPAPEGNGATQSEAPSGMGGGGGGGGMSQGRPVAAIIVGPNGVRVEPIVDPTKISLTLFTSIFKMVGSVVLRRGRRRK